MRWIKFDLFVGRVTQKTANKTHPAISPFKRPHTTTLWEVSKEVNSPNLEDSEISQVDTEGTQYFYVKALS